MNFTEYADISTVTDLAQAKESEYRTIDSTGKNVTNAAIGVTGLFGTVAGYLGFATIAKSLAAGTATGKAVDLAQTQFGTNAADIADAIDAVQNELSKAALSGDWSSPALAQAVADLEAIYPEQQKYSGLTTTPDLVAVIKEAIANKDLAIDQSVVDKFFDPMCFASGTKIDTPNDLRLPIENIASGTIVSCFASDYDGGRAPLVSGRVVRSYENVTSCFICLSFSDDRDPLTVTPGHLFLDETGGFTKIGDLLRLGGNTARVIDDKGEVITVKGEWLYYSAETAHLFERASTRSMVIDGNTVFKEEVQEGWRTYNFEVEGLHTYVAGGVRVHNHSGPLGDWANRTDGYIDNALGIQNGGFLDKLTDIVTSPIHAAGQIIDGISRAGTALSQGFQTARDLFANGDLAGAIGAVAGGIGNAIGEVASGIGRAVGEVVGDIADAVGSAIEGIGRAVSGALDSAFGHDSGHDGNGSDNGKPVIIDLDGDGVEINVNGQVSFDMDADGYKERTAWADADDGFLVVDFAADGKLSGGGDGKITQTKELVLTEILGLDEITDLQALAIMERNAAYGGNNDGILNAKDDLWQQLKIWQDLDQDGEVDAGELKTLDKFGIKQINLKYDDGTGYSNLENDVSIFGNTLLGSASYVKTDGTVVKGGVGDVSLSYDAKGWRRVDTALGYEIQFEAGGKLSIAELEGKASANLNLDIEALDGAVGDARANVLSANGHSRVVQISGGDGDDVLTGGDNDDMLSGDGGADHLRGMGGNDLIFLDAADLAAGKTVSGDSGIDTAYVVGSTGVNMKLLDHTFEAAYGSDGNDTLNARGLTDDTPMFGGKGNDTLYGSDGDDNLSGDAGSDYLDGWNGDDRLSGGDGHDTLNGNAGSDVLSGGTGNDSLDGGNGDDLLLGGAGADSLNGSGDDDRIDGGDGNDTLDGQEGDDFLTGGGGDDHMTFWYGDDTLAGENGNDTFVMRQGDIARGYWGWTVVQGGRGSDVLILPFAKSDWWQEKEAGTTNQWTFFHRDPDDYGKSMVISVQDVETVQFAGGATMTLSTNTALDTSDDYKRDGHNSYDGDSNARPSGSYTSSDGAFNAYMGDDYMNAIRTAQTGGSENGETVELAYNDFIRGMSGGDTIISGAGNDKVWGEFGDDAIRGDDGNDSILGGSGSDQIWGGAGEDTIQGDAGADVISGGSGNDSIDGEDGSDILSGDDGNDTLTGGTGADFLWGGNNSDILRGGTGADRLYGEAGNDRLEGEAGADVLSGGVGNDTLVGGDGFNILDGGDGDDHLVGGADDDMMSGGADEDTLSGGLGRDTLIGGAGADVLNGGSGILDMVSYEGSGARVVIDLEVISGADTLQTAAGGHATGDTLTGIEQVLGSDHDDILTGSSIDNVLIGGKGNDRLNGMDGHDDLVGGYGDDTISAGNGNDRVWGDAGNDTILGSWGQDTIYGGGGYDVIDFSASGTASSIDLSTNKHTGVAAGQLIYQVENVIGTQANDTISGNSANNVIDGHDGNDLLSGRSGNDTLDGGAGNDTLDGGAGADHFIGGSGYDVVTYANAASGVSLDLLGLTGGAGDAQGDTFTQVESVIGSDYGDTIRGGNSNNNLYGGDGDDILFGRGGTNNLFGGEGVDRAQYSDATAGVLADLQDSSINTNDAAGDRYYSIENLYGSSFNDNLRGDAGNNVLSGLAGNDRLYGRDGNDTLLGGDGADSLYGGNGTDRAQYSDAAERVVVDLANMASNQGDAAGDVFDSIENLMGSKFNDGLWGDSGDNAFWGYDGNDILSGRGGNDTLNGGEGQDTFIFSKGFSSDRVTDFENDVDTIRLLNFGVSTFTAARALATETNGNVVFDFGNGDTLQIDNTTLAALSNDVVFV